MRRIREEGTLLGTRIKKGRRFHFYFLRNSFVEVLFRNDDINQDAEHLVRFLKLEEFNVHVEREFNSHF